MPVIDEYADPGADSEGLEWSGTTPLGREGYAPADLTWFGSGSAASKVIDWSGHKPLVKVFLVETADPNLGTASAPEDVEIPDHPLTQIAPVRMEGPGDGIEIVTVPAGNLLPDFVFNA